MHNQTGLPRTLFAVICLLTVAVYAPGLRGAFLFDDFANLPALGATGPVHDAAGFWRYLTSGTADPSGRPVALLSFLIDARDWPADPFSFKRTNVLLHVFNGLLLFALLARLGRVLTKTNRHNWPRTDIAAVLASSIWLLHPLFVSTTLYIVQREAMLPATFVLLGLLSWLRGRNDYSQGRRLKGAAWCIVGLGGGTLLATLSKANGILLPLFAGIIEWIFLAPLRPLPETSAAGSNKAKRHYEFIRWLFLWLPSALVVFGLLYQGLPDIILGRTHGRSWTIGQRLLTESRVIVDYLRLLLVPHPYTSGLFNDQFLASNSLIDPLSTLWSTLLVLALLALGIGLRRRSPPMSLALLFFFGGHLIESTVLPLELYFEHRNYIPALLLFWPLSLWICGVPQLPCMEGRFKPIRVIPRVAIACTIIGVLALMTLARSDLWGNTREQALVWARINPGSPRAQANAAQALVAGGRPDLATGPLRRALSRSPSQVQLAMNLFGAECQMGHVAPATFVATERALRSTADPGALLTQWFERAIESAHNPMCPEIDFFHVGRLLEAAGENQRLMEIFGRRQDVTYLRGRLALAEGCADQALTYFNQALAEQLRIGAALRQAALLGSAGYPELGLAHLSQYDALQASAKESGMAYQPPFGMPRIHAWVLRRQGYWDRELARLRATLREDERQKKMRNE